MNVIIKEKYELDETTKKLVEEFVSAESDGKRYAFGRNQHSESLLLKMNIEAVIDDYAEEGTIWHNLPVIRRIDLPNDAIVVNCVTSISPIIVKNILEKQQVKFFGIYALPLLFPEKFDDLDFVQETKINYEKNKERWQNVYDNLEDDESKKTFSDILQYRLTGDYNFMSEYKVNLKGQYFEDFLGLQPREIFVDCGGFDGDTSEEFILRCPEYQKIYFFEPSEINLEKAKERLGNNTQIKYIDKGVSDKEEVLSFNFEGSASGICENGNFQIQTTTIDKFVKEKITFIKMDLEGWEMKALRGAEDHIKNDTPKLAIAVYHKPQDFYEIFEFIKSINSDYKVYLRQYTQGWSETVMFFIPL